MLQPGLAEVRNMQILGQVRHVPKWYCMRDKVCWGGENGTWGNADARDRGEKDPNRPMGHRGLARLGVRVHDMHHSQ